MQRACMLLRQLGHKLCHAHDPATANAQRISITSTRDLVVRSAAVRYTSSSLLCCKLCVPHLCCEGKSIVQCPRSAEQCEARLPHRPMQELAALACVWHTVPARTHGLRALHRTPAGRAGIAACPGCSGCGCVGSCLCCNDICCCWRRRREALQGVVQDTAQEVSESAQAHAGICRHNVLCQLQELRGAAARGPARVKAILARHSVITHRQEQSKRARPAIHTRHSVRLLQDGSPISRHLT